MQADLPRKFVGEALGTALLLSTVVGSGIMGERLAGGNGAIALLANTVATGAGLVAIVLTFGPISGAHFNPVVAAYGFTASTSSANPAVTLARAASDTFAGIRPVDAPGFIIAQLAGAAASTALFRWPFPALPDVVNRVVGRAEEPRSDRAHNEREELS